MNIFLWCLQGLLAFTFFYSGICKSIFPIRKLVSMGQTGVEHLPVWFVRFIGITEIAGAVGIIVPWLTAICPVLTPLSALCFALIMPFAAIIHYRRKENQSVILNLGILLVSVFVAVMRFQEL